MNPHATIPLAIAATRPARDSRWKPLLHGLLVTLIVPVAARADDPLQAFPTEELPAEVRVQQLTEAQRNRLKLPENGDQVVFSISTVRPAPANTMPPANAVKPAEVQNEPTPWLRVFADGRIEARSETNPDAAYCQDTLAKAELAWLLHLAVGECEILERTSPEIDAAIAALKKQSPDNARRNPAGAPAGNHYRYDVDVPAGRNQLSIPEAALVTRPVRKRLQLDPFASLNRYARFLAARTCLGNDEKRRAILNEVNVALLLKDAGMPLFKPEHIGASGVHAGGIFVAIFEQEIELGENRHRKATAIYTRRDPAANPAIQINVLDFATDRPR